jgi:hypothetical protein
MPPKKSGSSSKCYKSKRTNEILNQNIEFIDLNDPTEYDKGTVGAEIYKYSPGHPNYVCINKFYIYFAAKIDKNAKN